MLSNNGISRVQQLDRLRSPNPCRESRQPIDSGVASINDQEPPRMHPTESVNVAPTSGLSRQGTVSTNGTPQYRDNIEDEEQTGLEIASAALGRPERTGDVPFYTGKSCLYLRYDDFINYFQQESRQDRLLHFLSSHRGNRCQSIF